VAKTDEEIFNDYCLKLNLSKMEKRVMRMSIANSRMFALYKFNVRHEEAMQVLFSHLPKWIKKMFKC